MQTGLINWYCRQTTRLTSIYILYIIFYILHVYITMLWKTFIIQSYFVELERMF